MSSQPDSPGDGALPFAVVPTDLVLAKWICPTCTGVGSDQPRACPRCRAQTSCPAPWRPMIPRPIRNCVR